MPFTRLFVIALVLVGACGNATGPSSDLENAKAKWATARPLSYDITVQRLCFCPTELTSAVRISVRNGEITSRVYVSSGATVPSQYSQSFPNVEGLFLIVDEALGRNADKLDVSYDPLLGYPLSMKIDYVKNAVDDELNVTISNFVVK